MEKQNPLTFNQRVSGSNPDALTNKSKTQDPRSHSGWLQIWLWSADRGIGALLLRVYQPAVSTRPNRAVHPIASSSHPGTLFCLARRKLRAVWCLASSL